MLIFPRIIECGSEFRQWLYHYLQYYIYLQVYPSVTIAYNASQVFYKVRITQKETFTKLLCSSSGGWDVKYNKNYSINLTRFAIV